MSEVIWNENINNSHAKRKCEKWVVRKICCKKQVTYNLKKVKTDDE